MCHTEGFTLEARKINWHGSEGHLFWTIAEPGWIKLQFYEIDF